MAENLVSAMQPKLRDRYLDLKHKNMDFQVALEKMNQELDGLNSRKAVLEDEVALSALKREALTLYDNLRDLEQRRDELEEEEKHRGTPAQERERLLEQVNSNFTKKELLLFFREINKRKIIYYFFREIP